MLLILSIICHFIAILWISILYDINHRQEARIRIISKTILKLHGNYDKNTKMYSNLVFFVRKAIAINSRANQYEAALMKYHEMFRSNDPDMSFFKTCSRAELMDYMVSKNIVSKNWFRMYLEAGSKPEVSIKEYIKLKEDENHKSVKV